MIAFLEGEAWASDADRLVVNVGGVGYDLRVTQAVALDFRTVNRASFHIHTDVRDNAIDLYGFRSVLERDLFRLLITVDRVGGRLALKILDQLPAAELASAIRYGRKERLIKVNGVGAKAAERLVLDLKDKLDSLRFEDTALAAPVSQHSDTLAALQQLGFTEREAQAAVHEAMQADPNADSNSLLRLALKILRPQG